jgi:hypothetical protein
MFVIEAVIALILTVLNWSSARRRGGREAEGGGLLKAHGIAVAPGSDGLPWVHRGKTGCIWRPGREYTMTIHNEKHNALIRQTTLSTSHVCGA